MFVLQLEKWKIACALVLPESVLELYSTAIGYMSVRCMKDSV